MSEAVAEFSVSERNEIIVRLQAVESIVMAEELRLDRLIDMVQEIHAFCQRLAETLDALGGNPMIQAMVPPGTFGGTE